jgi:hypothetical protein
MMKNEKLITQSSKTNKKKIISWSEFIETNFAPMN